MIDKFDKALSRVCDILDSIGGFVMAGIMGLITVNVVMRVFGHPIIGAVEVVQFMLVITCALAIAYCTLRKGHVSVSFLVDKMPRTLRFIVEILISVIILAFVILTAKVISDYGISLRDSGQVGMETRIPFYPLVFMVAGAFFVCAVVAVNFIFQTIKNRKDN